MSNGLSAVKGFDYQATVILGRRRTLFFRRDDHGISGNPGQAIRPDRRGALVNSKSLALKCSPARQPEYYPHCRFDECGPR